MGLVAVSAAVAVAGFMARILTGPVEAPVPGACSRLEAHLQHELAGQGPAVDAAVDAVCAHLADKDPPGPLLISIHGPPGVGKTLFHKLLADALYNLTDGLHACPGSHCPAYKILLGVDYTVEAATEQFASLQKSILQHLEWYPSALLVVEEFDKSPCEARELVRQLVTRGGTAKRADMRKSIIILESNTGYLELYDLLKQSQWDRAKVDPDVASHVLKDALFSLGKGQNCSASHMEALQSHRFVNSVSEFLPFYPLDYEHIKQVAGLQLGHWTHKLNIDHPPPIRESAGLLEGIKNAGFRLTQWVTELAADGESMHLEWDDSVAEFLANKVYMDEDGFSVDGASGLRMIVSKYLSKAVRKWEQSLPDTPMAPHPLRLHISVAQSGNQLQVAVPP